jgi:hypothetical protein
VVTPRERPGDVQDSTRVSDLAPGASVRLEARVRGEDEFVLRGRIDDCPLPPAMPTCVEPGYDVRLTVDCLGWVHVAARVGNRYL